MLVQFSFNFLTLIKFLMRIKKLYYCSLVNVARSIVASCHKQTLRTILKGRLSHCKKLVGPDHVKICLLPKPSYVGPTLLIGCRPVVISSTNNRCFSKSQISFDSFKPTNGNRWNTCTNRCWRFLKIFLN
jgi:hypothetical protein